MRRCATRCARFAKGLHALGVRKGDKVAILMGNKPEWIIADLAICLLGGIMVAVNTWVTTRELQHILAHSDSTMLIASDRYLKYDYFAMLEELEPLAQSMPLLKRIVHVGDAPLSRLAFPSRDVFARGRDVADATIDAAQDAIDPKDLAYILYTSGSTSTPKGVQLQHYALIENMWNIGERMHVTQHDRLWLAVSLFWGLGCENALFNLMTHGGCVVLQESFEPGEALRIIAQERCTIFYGMPNMVQAIAEHPDRPKLRHLCAARRRHARHARATPAHRRSRRDGFLDDLRADRILRQLHRGGRARPAGVKRSPPSAVRCPASTCASSISRPARSSRAARSARSD